MTVGEHYAAQHQARMGKARSGMSRAIDGGRAFELLTPLARFTKPRWPTPKAQVSGPDYARINRERSGGDDLFTAVARETPGPLRPEWVEWLMGFPMGWTNLTQKGN